MPQKGKKAGGKTGGKRGKSAAPPTRRWVLPAIIGGGGTFVGLIVLLLVLVLGGDEQQDVAEDGQSKSTEVDKGLDKGLNERVAGPVRFVCLRHQRFQSGGHRWPTAASGDALVVNTQTRQAYSRTLQYPLVVLAADGSIQHEVQLGAALNRGYLSMSPNNSGYFVCGEKTHWVQKQ